MRFYAKIAGSRFIFSDGTEAVFGHGFIDINEQTCPGEYEVSVDNQNSRKNGRKKVDVYQQELIEILGKNPNIYVPEKLPEKMEVKGTKVDPAANAFTEVELAQKEREVELAAKGNVRVEQQVGNAGVGAGIASHPDVSTVDPEIAAEMLASRQAPHEVVGPGADKIAQMRADAAARSAQVTNGNSQ